MKSVRELLLMVVAALVAVVIIVVVEKVIVPEGNFLPTRRGIFSLEVAVLLILMGAYVYAEVLHAMEFLRRSRRSGADHIGLNLRDVSLLLLSLAGSLSIYLAIIKIFGLT